jgi:hypothetical protein
MKRPAVYSVSIVLIVFLGWVAFVSARPLEFSEVSLLVRARDSENSILQDVSQRKLLYPLTPQQESKLKAEGASDALLRALKNPNFVVSKEDAAALEAAREQRTKVSTASRDSSGGWEASNNVQVFDVALGHPINLSQWGGSDYELAFYSYRCAGEDIVEPALIDNIRTGTTVYRNITEKSEGEAFAGNSFRQQRFIPYDNDAHRFTPYDGRRDLKDDRFNFRDTVSVSSWSASRNLAIDWSSPVTIKGVPYALYPVYGAGGVSLYFISASSTSVRLAVATRM